MRIRTMAGLTAAGAAAVAAVIGGVAYASADENEPIVRIVTDESAGTRNAVQQEQPQDEDCPDKTGEAAPSTNGAGL
jgi:hypothetical protein